MKVLTLRKSLVLVLILLFGSALSGRAQKKGQAFADSVTAELPKTTDPDKKMLQCWWLDSTYIQINVDSSFKYAKMRLEIARSTKQRIQLVRSLVSLSRCYYYLGRNDDVIKCCKEAEALCEGRDDLRANRVRALSNLGSAYMALGDFATSLEYTLKALPIAEALKDSTMITVLEINVGMAFLNQNNLDKALLYQEKALAMAETRHDNYGQRKTLENLGHIYFKKKMKAKAIPYWRRFIQMMIDTKDSVGLAAAYNTMVAYHDDNTDSALYYALKAKAIWARVAPEDYQAYENLGNLGDTYETIALDSLPDKKTGLKRTAEENRVLLVKAEENLSAALAYFKKSNNQRDIVVFSKGLAGVQYHLHDFKNAFENLSASDSLSDSVFSQDSKNKLAAVEEQREIAVRDKQITVSQLELANQKRQRWYLIGGLVLVLLIGGLLYRQNIARKRTNTVLLQLNTELDEANEVKTKFFNILNHDLRAPVASLINLLQLQKDEPGLLEEQVAANHAQRIFANAENLLVTMEDLLLWSKGQMKMFKPSVKAVAVEDLFADLRNYFSGVADVRLTFDSSLSSLTTDEHYLKTIMRNLTNNAIKALENTPDGVVSWKAWEEDGKQYLSVTDNGPGVNDQQLKALYDDSATIGGKTGLGLHVVRDLARAIGCLISVRSLPVSGTEFILSL